VSSTRPPPVALGLLSVLFAVLALWLVLHNPTVDSASLGEYTCTAPYDTVLNDADNVPGGEPPPDADEVEARCIDSGETRFNLGLVSGAAAVVLVGTAGVLALRSRVTTSRA
jgi:hypothetical protein